MFGPHLTLDLYGCDKEKLNDYNYIHKMLNEMPEMLGMHKFSAPQLTPIPAQANSFDKGGLTGFVILVESHIAIHTFPVDGFASFDIFSCKYFSEDTATKYLMEKLGAKRVELNRLERGRDFVKHYPRNVQKAAVIANKERTLVR
ncbi:adenosylmethionine decarboxylase [Candidatus Woesearchaeota archaeon]|nr:adenosylmethionine decarboxylase [Candidatus Woesearchaeota archaeon]